MGESGTAAKCLGIHHRRKESTYPGDRAACRAETRAEHAPPMNPARQNGGRREHTPRTAACLANHGPNDARRLGKHALTENLDPDVRQAELLDLLLRGIDLVRRVHPLE